MKRLIFITLMTLSLSVFSQSNENTILNDSNETIITINDSIAIEYPLISIDSLGNKIVILTMEQAKFIDNKLDVLNLLQDSDDLISDMDSICIKVINEKDQIIAKQDIKISKMDSLLVNRNDQIDNLKQQISIYEQSESILLQQLDNKDIVIDLHLDRIDKLEKKTLWGGITGGAIIVTLVAILIGK